MPADDEEDRLGALGARIDAARAARRPQRSPGAEKFTAASLAWRMVTELVTGVLLGAGLGWTLDGLLATKPFLLIVFGLLGFAAGVRTMMRTAAEVERREAAARAAAGTGPDAGSGDKGPASGARTRKG
jgi:ATP synthase protein I